MESRLLKTNFRTFCGRQGKLEGWKISWHCSLFWASLFWACNISIIFYHTIELNVNFFPWSHVHVMNSNYFKNYNGGICKTLNCLRNDSLFMLVVSCLTLPFITPKYFTMITLRIVSHRSNSDLPVIFCYYHSGILQFSTITFLKTNELKYDL